MRLVRSALCLIAVLCIPARSLGQSTGQPALLPPPSTPWQPPAPKPSPAPTLAPTPTLSPAAAAPGAPVEPLPVPPAADSSSNLAGEAATAGIVCEEPHPWYRRVFLITPVPWDTGIELGINGSSGTSDSFSMRTGGYIKRESKFSKLDLSTYYNRTSSNGAITQNNAQFDIRNDWLMDEKAPWTLFATNTVFYDEFKAFDVQTNLDLGIGYRFYHEKDLQLIGRVGGGTSKEFGGPDDRWVPESLFGVEYSQNFNKTQKLYAKLDYFPEWDQVGEFRAVADTGWEVVLVQPSMLGWLKKASGVTINYTNRAPLPRIMNDTTTKLWKATSLELLAELQATLEREIPMSAQMGMRVHEGGLDGLVVRLPLNPNRNHQQTAFAGSLSALCTIAGWGYVFLLLKELGRTGSIVIHRSTIKYLQPVTSPEIYALCRPATAAESQYFLEMLDDKGQTKLELSVEVAGSGGPAVSFKGSYVVLPPNSTFPAPAVN